MAKTTPSRVYINNYKKANVVYKDKDGRPYIKAKGKNIFLDQNLPEWITQIKNTNTPPVDKSAKKTKKTKSPVRTPSPQIADYETDQVRYLAELIKYHDDKGVWKGYHVPNPKDNVIVHKSHFSLDLRDPMKGYINGLGAYMSEIIATLRIHMSYKWNKTKDPYYEVELTWKEGDKTSERFTPEEFVAKMIARMSPAPPTSKKHTRLRRFMEIANSGKVGSHMVLSHVNPTVCKHFSLINLPHLKIFQMNIDSARPKEQRDDNFFIYRTVDDTMFQQKGMAIRKVYSVSDLEELPGALKNNPRLMFPYAIAIKTGYTDRIIENPRKRNGIRTGITAIYPYSWSTWYHTMYTVGDEYEDLYYIMPKGTLDGCVLFDEIPAYYIPYLVEEVCRPRYCGFCGLEYVETIDWLEIGNTGKIVCVVVINTEGG